MQIGTPYNFFSLSFQISVWNFRQDNQGNSIAKAYYSGPTITQQLKDFTICFRYRISFFNTGGSGIDIFRAEDPNSKAHVHLRLFNDDYANRFEIQNAEKVKQVIWFHAEVPVRQWNSMCLIRDVKLKKFQIFQNNDLVYSYGECTTTGQLNEYFPTKVKDQPCHNQTEWYFNVRVLKNLTTFYSPWQANLQFPLCDTQILCEIKFCNLGGMKVQFWRS